MHDTSFHFSAHAQAYCYLSPYLSLSSLNTSGKLKQVRGQPLSVGIVSLLQHSIVLPVDVTGFVIQAQGAQSKHIQAVVHLDPVRKHVHAGNRAASGPDIAIHDPLALLGPLDLGVLLPRPVILDVVDRCILAVQYARRSQNRGARAGGEYELAGGDVLADEFDVLWREVVMRGAGSADEQGVQLRTVVDRGGGHDGHGAGQQVLGLQVLADVVENEFRGTCNGFRVELRVVCHGLEEGFATGVEEVEGPDDIDGLVVVDQGAEVEWCHCCCDVVSKKREFGNAFRVGLLWNTEPVLLLAEWEASTRFAASNINTILNQ